MRLIDANKLKKHYSWYYNRELIDAIVDRQKTIDAVPVIRCKDCKWWRSNKKECIEWYDSPYAPADGYCFRAERKEE